MTAKVQRPLKPFRRLYNIDDAVTAIQVNEQHKNENVASMTKKPPPTAVEDMMNAACTTKAEVDEALCNEDFPPSVSMYDKAYSRIIAGHQLPLPLTRTTRGSRVSVSSAKQNLLFTLVVLPPDIVAALRQLRDNQGIHS